MASKNPSELSFLKDNAIMSIMRDRYTAFSERRKALGLPNPGTADNIAREVQKDVLLSNFMFTGLRADVAKTFSAAPIFQVSHAFAMGSQGLPPYNFGAFYGTPKFFGQGTVDNEGQVRAQANYRWTESLVTKSNIQIAPGQAMLQVDHEYNGNDFSASLKSFNPSYIEGGLTGMFIGSYLQSVTPHLAVGMEAVWQRPALNQGPDVIMSYCAKYKAPGWITSVLLQGHGAINTSYWRRLTDKVEVGADLNLQFAPGMGGGLIGGLRKEGTTTLGAKYDFRASTLRGQVDSTGTLSVLLEKRVLGFVQITFAGALDHLKQAAKVGLAVSVEVPNEDIMEQQEKAANANIPPPPF